jgi:hypothetical protein
MEDRLSLVHEADTPYDRAPGAWRRQQFRHEQPADADLVVANMASRSVVIVLPEAERTLRLERAREIVPTGRFTLPWVTDAWVTTP